MYSRKQQEICMKELMARHQDNPEIQTRIEIAKDDFRNLKYWKTEKSPSKQKSVLNYLW